jgi:hypothetical protein
MKDSVSDESFSEEFGPTEDGTRDLPNEASLAVQRSLPMLVFRRVSASNLCQGTDFCDNALLRLPKLRSTPIFADDVYV